MDTAENGELTFLHVASLEKFFPSRLFSQSILSFRPVKLISCLRAIKELNFDRSRRGQSCDETRGFEGWNIVTLWRREELKRGARCSRRQKIKKKENSITFEDYRNIYLLLFYNQGNQWIMENERSRRNKEMFDRAAILSGTM